MATRTPLCSPLLPLPSVLPLSSLFPLPSVLSPLSSPLARAPPYLRGGRITYYVLRTSSEDPPDTSEDPNSTTKKYRKAGRGREAPRKAQARDPASQAQEAQALQGAKGKKDEGRQNTKTCPPVGQKKKIRSTISIMSESDMIAISFWFSCWSFLALFAPSHPSEPQPEERTSSQQAQNHYLSSRSGRSGRRFCAKAP